MIRLGHEGRVPKVGWWLSKETNKDTHWQAHYVSPCGSEKDLIKWQSGAGTVLLDFQAF